MNVLSELSFNFYPAFGALPMHRKSYLSSGSLTQLMEAEVYAETFQSYSREKNIFSNQSIIQINQPTRSNN
jgi:hypothetical protein